MILQKKSCFSSAVVSSIILLEKCFWSVSPKNIGFLFYDNKFVCK